jgi:hypothetical protein
LKEPTTEMSANLEYPACPFCESERRQFPFRLHEPYRVARCMECGLHYLYPRLVESAMQQAYRESSYYEGGACGYADTSYTAQEFALRATFKRLLLNLAKRGLTGGVPTPVEVQSLRQHADFKSDQPMFRDLAPGKWSTRQSDSPYLRRRS